MDSTLHASQRLVRACIFAIAMCVCLDAVAADEATATLRREHREEAQALRQQQSPNEPAPDASAEQRAPLSESQVRERAVQDELHARQLRQQLQSSQIRQLQEREFSAGQAQIQLQQFRRERDALQLQRELLRPRNGGAKR
jgi:hypothetical protein